VFPHHRETRAFQSLAPSPEVSNTREGVGDLSEELVAIFIAFDFFERL
jgi:hypothetical protein